jgi:hypothetical protein
MWDGQILLSMYYRLLIFNNSLFCEARFVLLPPLKDKYLQINNIPSKPTLAEFVANSRQSLARGVFSWIPVLLYPVWYILGGFIAENASLRRGRWRREVETNRLYNYGWTRSLREKWSSSSFERYFQKVDKDVSLKLLTNGFLAWLQEVLAQRNISIEQFKQTTTKIINEGVMISGGEVKAETLAVGKGAKIARTAINSVSGGGARS